SSGVETTTHGPTASLSSAPGMSSAVASKGSGACASVSSSTGRPTGLETDTTASVSETDAREPKESRACDACDSGEVRVLDSANTSEYPFPRKSSTEVDAAVSATASASGS